ncbi:hypothetical protein D3C72_1573510 [compost metagenome]
MTPTPGVEFRVLGGTQMDVTVPAGHAQQEPDLFLALVVAADLAADELVRHLVTQPVACATYDPDVLRKQAGFLMQFAVHGLFRRLAVLDAALRKLPGVFADSLAPENLVTCVDEDDADVRAKAFTIEHDCTSNPLELRRL